MSTAVVTIRNPQGHALHCMLEEPCRGSTGAPFAAVLLSPGAKTRVGPHRLNRKLARPFLERGIPVMRVDFRGLGDSEGDWPDETLEHIYRHIELGHCVADARAALDWMQSRFGIRRFIVGGLCGAAMTALHLAREDARLQALFAIGLPVRLDPSGGPPAVTHAELQSHWLRYLRKVARPGAWLRLLSLKSDYRLMGRAIVERLRQPRPTASTQIASAPDLNPHVAPAMLELLQSGRVALILFGDQDPRRWDFEEKFFAPWSGALEPYRAQIAYSILAGANHVLGAPGAVAQAIRLTGVWLETLLAGAQVPVQEAGSAAMLRSARGSSATEIHPSALECVIKPMRASAQHDVQLCSTNESSSSTRPRK